MNGNDVKSGMKVLYSAFRGTTAEKLMKPFVMVVRGPNHTGNGTWDLVEPQYLSRTLPYRGSVYPGVEPEMFEPAE